MTIHFSATPQQKKITLYTQSQMYVFIVWEINRLESVTFIYRKVHIFELDLSALSFTNNAKVYVESYPNSAYNNTNSYVKEF